MYNNSGTMKYYKLDALNSGVATWREINFVSKVSDIVPISSVSLTSNVSSTCSITGSINDGKMLIIVYTNASGSDKLVTVPTTYATPKGEAIELTVSDGGYCEVNYLNISGIIYARGL